jgi:hypothetical protein
MVDYPRFTPITERKENLVMNAKEAKDFLVQQTAEQAALENVPLSELEKRMMYFVENDPASCADPLELNDEFEAQYDTAEYEAKIKQLLHDAYKRLKTEEPEKARNWDDAMRALYDGDHYLPVLWDAHDPNGNRKRDPGSKVITCGTMALIAFALMLALINIPHIPSWIFTASAILFFFLCILTMFFLAQQGYRALRRRKLD